MSTKARARSAKGVLSSLTAGTKAHEDQGQEAVLDPQPVEEQQAIHERQDTEQTTEESGKAPLPPDEPEGTAEGETAGANEDEGESEEEDAWEDEDDAEPEEPEPSFSDQDKADLLVLEAQVKHHGLEQAKAIRQIRQRKLWMLHRNGDGSRRYKSYDEYIEDHHGRTRQWATQQTQWLAVVEKLQELRPTHPDLPEHLSANAVSGLWQLDAAGGYQGSTQEEQEENGLVAVIEEAQEEGVSFSRDNLRTICERRVRYFRGRKGTRPPAAPTYAVYKRDCEVGKLLSGGSFGVVGEAHKLPGSFADNLLRICTEQRKQPRADELLEVVTGTSLEEIMPRLVMLAQDVTDTEVKKNLLKTRKAEIRAMQNEGGLAKLREEAKALQTELEEQGVIKKRGGGSAKKNEGVADQTGKDEDALEDAGDEDTNDVQESLDTALFSLNAAITAEWPDADADVLQTILDSAAACEEAVAEITNKAKERLADKPKQTIALHDPYFPDD